MDLPALDLHNQTSRRGFLGAVAAAGGLLALGACSSSGGSPSGVQTIKFVGNGSDASGFEARAKAFEKTHSKINVKVEAIPAKSWGELLQTLSVNIAGGDIPDIADIASEGQRAFAENNVTTSIDSYLQRDAGQLKATLSDIDQRLLDAMKIDGKMYGLPTVWNSMVIYYNKKVLADAGLQPPTDDWTIDQFIQMSQTVAASGSNHWGYAFSNAYFLTIVPWMIQNGGNVLSDDWRSSRLRDPASIAAVQLLHDFIWKYKISPKLDGNITDVDLFVQNKLAFMGAGMWDVNSLKLAKFDPADYDVVPFPKIGANPQKYLVGIGAAPIFTASQHKGAAWEFAKFLSSPGFQDTFIVNDGWSIPATRSGFNKIMQRPDFPKNGKIFYDSLDNSVLVPSPKQYGAIEASLLREFGAAMANSKSVDDAMAAADKDVSAALKS